MPAMSGPPRLSPEQIDALLTRPIVVLGSARSGTTFIGKVLGAHPDLAYLIEPRLLWKYGNDGRSDMLNPDHATPAIRAWIRRALAQRVQRAGKPRLLEKSPSNALRPAFVDAVLPEARFIHIIRNGYDAVLSVESFWESSAHGLSNVTQGRLGQRLGELSWWRLPYYLPEFARRVAPGPLRGLLGPNAWGPRLPGMGRMLAELGERRVSCLQWRTCVEQSCAFGRSLPADRYFEARLEDLDRDTVERMLAFCDLPPSETVTRFLDEHYDRRKVSARTRDADPAAIAEIAPWIEPTNRWLGYTARPGGERNAES